MNRINRIKRLMMNDDQAVAQLKAELKGYKAEYEKLRQRCDTFQARSFVGSDVLPDPVVFYNLYGEVLHLNPAFTRIFGWDLPEFIQHKKNFIPPEKYQETREWSKIILKGRRVPLLETRRFTKDSQLLDIELSSAPHIDPSGAIIGCVVVYRDVTEKKKVEAQLIESREKYRSLMEAVADPIIVYDIEGRVMYFNNAFSRVFRWELSEVIHRKLKNFVPEENKPETRDMRQKVLAGEFFSGIESARYDRNGNIIPVSMSGSVFRDQNNRIIGSVINIRDISRQRQAQDAEKRQEKLKGVLELAGAVCHELSQPAMIIDGYADILMMAKEDDPKLKSMMVKLKDQIGRISTMTEKLMKITRYESREYAQGKTIVDIDRASEAL